MSVDVTRCVVSIPATALCCSKRVVVAGSVLFGGFTFNKQPDVSATTADDNSQSEAATSDSKTSAKPEEKKANPFVCFSQCIQSCTCKLRYCDDNAVEMTCETQTYVQVGFGDVAAAGGDTALSQSASFTGFDGSGSQLFGGAKASSRADGGGDGGETGE